MELPEWRHEGRSRSLLWPDGHLLSRSPAVVREPTHCRQYGVKTLRHNYSLGEFLRLCDYNAILSITPPPPPVWAPITRGKWTLTYICLQNASNLSVRFYKSLQLSGLSYFVFGKLSPVFQPEMYNLQTMRSFPQWRDCKNWYHDDTI